MDPERVTAVILTKDEAVNVGGALASLPRGMPALVIDAESQDGTREIARRAGAQVVVRSWSGFVDARRAALALVETPWALFLDADERLDSALRAAILAAPESGAAGFEVLRTTEFCGRAMHLAGWRDEPLLRLVRRDLARVEARPAAGGRAQLHERWAVRGGVVRLAGTLQHRSYPTLAAYRVKFARYTSIEAEGIAPSLRRAAAAALLGVLRAAWLLIARGGWRDGWRGIYVCAASAFYPATAQIKALARARSRSGAGR